MYEDNFFLVLPSNSSMKYFPDNTTTCFTTQLSSEIRLHGRWVVGLTEIHIPCTIVHLNPDDCTISWIPCNEEITREKIPLRHASISRGLYTSHEQLMREINNIPGLKESGVQLIDAKKAHGYVGIEASARANIISDSCYDKPYAEWIKMSDKVKRILGFDHVDTVQFTHNSEEKISFMDSKIGERPACINRALPNQLYVYTDICEHYTVGDTQAALLRIVNLDTTHYLYGSTQVKYFSPPNYIRLLNSHFRSITIDIRDHLGKPIPFEYGTLTLTLHFKRIG